MISEFPKVLPENFKKQSTISAMWQNTESTCKNQWLSYTTTKTYRDLLVPTMAFLFLLYFSSPVLQLNALLNMTLIPVGLGHERNAK